MVISLNDNIAIQEDRKPKERFKNEMNSEDSQEANNLERDDLTISKVNPISNNNIPIMGFASELSAPVIKVASLVKPLVAKRPIKEMGLSRKYFTIGLLNGLNLAEDVGDEVFLNSDFDNISATYRKWVRPKLSIESGLYYTIVKGNINFDVHQKYAEEDLDEFFELALEDIAKRPGLVFRTTQSTNIADLPEVDLGDEINLSGFVDIDLKLLQFPVIANLHWYKKRIEYFTGLGFSLDYSWGDRSSSAFNMTHEGITYDLQLREELVDNSSIGFTLQLNTGMKLYLADHLNAEIALHLSPSNLLLSAANIGIYYRLNK